MKKQPLKDLFDAMYHGKPSFDDFLNSPMGSNYDVVNQGSESGKVILRPRDKLKVFHKFLSLFLFEFLPINERVVFSYRKGFSAVNAVEKHRLSKYFFQTDIKSFFYSIDDSLVYKTISLGAQNSPISDIDVYLDRVIELVCVMGSLPVGFPASAQLSNSVLYEFDNALELFCNNKGLIYSRYADDIIISGAEQDAVAGMDDVVQELLHKFASTKFSIHKGKTKFFQVGNKVKILGMMILPNGKISPDTKKRKELEVLLHYFVKDRKTFYGLVEQARARSKKVGEFSDDDGLDILSGNLNYVDSIDSEYTNKLRRKFGAGTIDMLMHRGFSGKK